MIDRTRLAVLFGLLSLAYGLQCPKQQTSPGREVVCYTSVSSVEQLSEAVCKCTTLVHQNHDVRNLSVSDFEDFRKSLKEISPPLQFVISVDDPAKTLRTSGTVRQEIAARLIGVLKEVDGVELNMTAGSKERLFHFVKGLKDELVRKSYDKRIFLVLPTTSEDLAKQFDLKELSKYVDLFTIPTHYLAEDDEAYRTFHPSRLMGLFDMFNADSLIDLITGLGAPKRKILMSVPASGYKFTLKDQDDNAPRAPTEEIQPVIIDQKQLCDLMNRGEWTVERDEDLTAPYAFKDKTWIAFEDRISIAIKGKYVLLRGLPGLAIHDIENDFKTDCGESLAHDTHHSFSDFKRKSRAAVLNALEDDLHQTELEYSTKVKSSDFRVVRVVDTEGHIRAVRENTQTEFTCSRQGYFVHPKSCNRFYRCVKFNQEVEDYSVFEFDCPAGLSFDERTEVCVWPGSMPEGSPCPGSSEIAPVARVRFECPDKPGYYADPQNPRWFFACIDLGGPEVMAFEFRCPYGLIFDEHKLVCEWPWLVPGYSDTAYTRPEYDSRGHGGTGSTPGTGGYYTGGLPHGFTGTSGGVYSGTTGGSGYIATGSGYSGTAGIGHSGSGAVGPSHGVSYGGQGSTGYSGTTGSGYSGSGTAGHGISYGGQGAVGHGGATGSGYSGSGTAGHGVSYGGQGAGGHGGATGSGYSGSGTAGHGVSYGGQGAVGHGGTTGSGYSGSGTAGHGISYGGQGAVGHGGTTGSGYSGSGTAGHGVSYGGQGTVGHGGTTGSGYPGSGTAGHGISYSGQGTIGHGGATGSGYSGSGTAGHGVSYGGQGAVGHGGTTGSVYPGSETAGHGISYGGQGTIGHGGTTGSGYSGSGTVGHGVSYGGQGTIGHGGTTGSGYSGSGTAGHGVSYGGQGTIGHGGTTGSGYSGSGTAGHGVSYGGQGTIGHGGTTGSGYPGSGTAGHGISYGGQGAIGHGGTTGSGYSGSGTAGHGISYSGQGAIGHGGTTGSGYPGSGTAGHGISYGGQGATGHGGTTGSGYSGSGTIGQGHAGDGKGGHFGSTSGTYAGSQGTGYAGAGNTGHAGTSGVYTGIGGTDYAGTSGSSSTSGHGVIGHGTGYQGSTGTVHGGFTGSPGTGTIHGGSTGIIYLESSGAHAGSTAGSHVSVTEGYDGPGVKGGRYPSPSHGATTPGPVGIDYSGPHTSGVSGHGYPGHGVTFGTHTSQIPIYGTAGTTGSGIVSTGVTSVHAYTPGPTPVSKPDQPNCVSLRCYEGTVPSGGQTYVTHGVTSGTNIYQGTSGYAGGLNTTLTGSHVPSIGGVTYHGGFTPINGHGITTGTGAGTIITGHNIQGSITTGDSTPGTLITYGGSSGSVHSGSSDQGSIVTGGSYPGYTKVGSGSPGYTIHDGVKTIYPGSTSTGTVIYGKPSPGVVVTEAPGSGTIIKGQSTPGIILTGHTAPGVSIGGSVDQGTIVGSTGHHAFTDTGYQTHPGSVSSGSPYGTKIGTVPSAFDKTPGYQTNEYHDNGGRGTIKFNNGDVTTKYTENDIPDYRPAGGTIPPDTLIPGGKVISGGSTVSGFTNTGPIKTGFTTATGGGGSYNTDKIGAKAFEGNVVGYTKSSTESTVDAHGPYGHGFSHGDTSKIIPGSSKGPGYSYPTPSIPFETGVTKNLPISQTESNIFGPATPTPFLNVELYNTPKAGHSAFHGSPGFTSTYQQPSGFTKSPTATGTPVVYTTGPLENYKTTVFQAAKVPVAISTVHQVIDNGYKTVVSSTPVPVTLTEDKFGGIRTGSQYDFGTRTQQTGYQHGYVSSTTPSSPFRVTTTYPEKQQINYGPTTPSSGSAYFDTTSKSIFGQGVTPSSISGSLKPQTQYIPGESISPDVGVTYRKPFPLPDDVYKYSSSPIPPVTSKTYTSAPSGYGTAGSGSPANIGISRDQVGKLVTNYNRGTTKYVPSPYDVYTPGSISGSDYSRTQSSSTSTFQQGYRSSTPASISKTQSFPVATYTGGYTKPSSIITYQTTDKSTAVGKGKVIVKWSDLHPLLLGKLGAECTCRGDPFANLRGPGSKLINSSKGKVDLSNYDESEIYVDLEKEGSYEDNDYVTNYESSSVGPVKIWNNEIPKLLGSPSTQVSVKPSSAYPATATSSVNLGAGAGASGFSSNPGFSAHYRSAKSLNGFGDSTDTGSPGSSVDYVVPDGESEETLEGATNCARPGLFRHPNFCNKFYACHWDDWKKKFTLHVFNCPVHLTFDNGAGACNWPSMGPACQDDNLLV